MSSVAGYCRLGGLIVQCDRLFLLHFLCVLLSSALCGLPAWASAPFRLWFARNVPTIPIGTAMVLTANPCQRGNHDRTKGVIMWSSTRADITHRTTGKYLDERTGNSERWMIMGNGYIDDVHGWNFVSKNRRTADAFALSRGRGMEPWDVVVSILAGE